MLTAQPEISAQLSFTAYSRGTQNQQWRIQRDTQGNYFITNRAHPHLMIREGNNGIIDLATTSANAGWRFVDYIQASHWPGGYLGQFHNGVARVGIGIASSAIISGYMEMDNVYRYANAWNGISGGINVTTFRTLFAPMIYTPDVFGEWTVHPSWPMPDNTFGVIVVGIDSDANPGLLNYQGSRLLGVFSPDGIGIVPNPAPSVTNRGWRWATIYMCMGTGSDMLLTLSEEERQAVFIHEVGHVLKLSHPCEDGNWIPTANMSNTLSYVHGRPTGYDRFNLMRLWGR